MASTATKSERRSWRRILARIALMVALAYLGIVILFVFLENYLIFFPTRASSHWQPALSADWQDVYFNSADGNKIHAWWCPREGAVETLLFCHGNAGNLSHRGPGIHFMQKELNVSVLIFDYPGYGYSNGSPNEASCYAAGDAAYKWLVEKQKIAGKNIILFGNSLGGGVATHLAKALPHRALIMTKTYTSLPEVGQRLYPWLPVRFLMRTRFDNLGRLKDCHRPIVIGHGKNDSLIHFSHAQRLHDAAGDPKMLYFDDAGDHNSPMPAEFFRAARKFIDEHQ